MRICIDPGHGGQDCGAVGLTGLHEADVNLAVAEQLKEILEDAGHAAYLTRTLDRFIPLDVRAKTCNVWGADLFVSIHCNAASNPEAHGFEIWTSKGKTKADAIAESVIVAWLTDFPNINIRRDYTDGDSDKESDFAVLRLTKCPAILIEMGFISHQSTEAQMRTFQWVDAAANAIAKGITA